MIYKKSYNNKQNIEKDKERFVSYCLKRDLEYLDILDFLTEHYENLNSLKYNFEKLKGGLKE